jgi:hypothetical protein
VSLKSALLVVAVGMMVVPQFARSQVRTGRPTSYNLPNCENPLSNDCPNYPPPTCNVISSNDYRYEVTAPNFTTNVTPAMSRHYSAHYSNYPTYELPVTFLWDSLGIADLVGDPQPPIKTCLNIKFTRNAQKPPLATFLYAGDTETVQTKPNPFFSQTLSLTIPKNMMGFTIVTGGSIEFHFQEQAVPHLVVTNSDGSTASDVLMQCVKVTYREVDVKPLPDPAHNEPGSKNNPDFVIHP